MRHHQPGHRVGVGREQERVAVRRGLLDAGAADRAVGAGPVLDHDADAHAGLHPFGHHAGERIDAAAGRERHDDPDHAARILVLRKARLRAGENRGGRQDGGHETAQ
jgi:hypothetical protein